MAEYPYTIGNLLEKPNTYFYTPYDGMDFLSAWMAERRKIRSFLGSGTEPSFNGGQYSLKDKRIDTDILLDTLCYRLSCGKRDDLTEELGIARKMVKRFEITKRIHRYYDDRFRIEDKDAYHDLNLYVKAAELFEMAYNKTEELPFLNALIKCIDTLSSVKDSLGNEAKGRVSRLISKESQHVASIARSKGVKI